MDKTTGLYSVSSSSQKQVPGKSLKTGQAHTKPAFSHLQLKDFSSQKWFLCIWKFPQTWSVSLWAYANLLRAQHPMARNFTAYKTVHCLSAFSLNRQEEVKHIKGKMLQQQQLKTQRSPFNVINSRSLQLEKTEMIQIWLSYLTGTQETCAEFRLV